MLAAAVCVGVGLAVRLDIAFLPPDLLTARYLADDYFYYLNVAQHIAHGHGSTFDGGVTITNGFQPLFGGLLVIVFLAGASKTAALHAGLALQALAAAAAATLAFALLQGRDRAWGGVLAAGLLSHGLFFVLPSVTGFEMALALALALATLLAYERGLHPAWIGAACGLSVVARVDALALAGVVGVGILRKRGRRALAGFGAAVAVATLPWFGWSWARFGTPLPESGSVKLDLRTGESMGESVRVLVEALPRVVLPDSWMTGWSRGTVWPWLAGAVLLGVAALRARTWPLPAAYAALHALAYVVWTDGFEPGALVRYLYTVWAVVLLLTAASRPFQAPVWVALVLVLHLRELHLFLAWDRATPPALSYVGAGHSLAPRVLRSLVKPDERVGAFDAGSLGYFAPRTVINLDGLMNHDIVELKRSCRVAYRECLLDYLERQRIGVLAGGSAFGWTSLLPEWTGWERLYESPPLAGGGRWVLVRLPRAPAP